MDILKIVNILEKFDPEVYGKLDTRRKAMSQFAGIGKKLSLAAMPLAVSAMFNKAYGQTTSNPVLDALQFALKAEYIEAELYVTGVNAASALGVEADLADGLKRLAYDELLHTKGVIETIKLLGGRPEVPYKGPIKPTGADYGIDLTGGGGTMTGPFAPALANLDVFLAAAQVFEDNGVRAYKGQAGIIAQQGNAADTVLAAGLGIHSVEARHAAYLRYVRAKRASESNPTSPKPWVTNADPGIPAPYAAKVAPVYAGEDTATQSGVNITPLANNNAAQATESFDEPNSKENITAYITGALPGYEDVKFIY